MSKNNENCPITVMIPVGTQATDNTQVPGFYFPKKSKIVSAMFINGADIAASDTDYVQPSLLNLSGAAIIAELDSRAAHENGLVKNTPKAMNLPDSEVDAGTTIYADYQEAGTVTLTNAVIALTYFPL